jgi:hypothetical protein
MQRIDSVYDLRKFLRNFHGQQAAGWARDQTVFSGTPQNLCASKLDESASAFYTEEALEAARIAAWLSKVVISRSLIKTRFVTPTEGRRHGSIRI